MSAPCVHAGGADKLVETTSSWVADLRGPKARHWVTATAAPCVSLFKPVAVDAPVDLGASGDDRFDDDVMWWRHERLHRLVDRDPAAVLADIAAERDSIEAGWVADPPSSEAALEVAAATEARWLELAAGTIRRDRRPLHVRGPRAEHDREAGIPAV